MNVFSKSLVSLLVVTLLLSGCSGNDLFVSEGGAFRVNFVTVPEDQVQSVSTPIGDIEMHMFPDVIGDSAVFVVSYGDLPDGFVKEVDVDEFLDSAALGALEGFGISEVEIDEEFFMEGNAGLHQRGTSTDYYSDYYNFLVGDRFYQLIYVKQFGYAGEKELDASVGSFELIN